MDLSLLDFATGPSSMELTGGQLDAGEPEAQLVGVVGRISTVCGVKVHEAWMGRPEQESSTNIGDVRAVLSSGNHCHRDSTRLASRKG